MGAAAAGLARQGAFSHRRARRRGGGAARDHIRGAGRYVAWLPAELVCDAIVEAIVGTDTARAVWPLVVDTLDRSHPAVNVLNDDTAHTGKTDSLTVGKAVPYGTYNWFFPLGTSAVANGRWAGQTRLQLSRGTVAWVNTADVVPLAAGPPPP